MASTALQLVNKILVELRESTVSDFSANYTVFVLQKLNQAKREVEDACPWDALRTVVTFPTVSGTETYNLGTGGVGTGGTTNERSYLVKDEYGREMVYDTTSKTQLSLMGAEYHRSLSQLAQMSNAPPGPFSLNRSASGYTMRLYPKPNGVYTITSTWIIPQPDFSSTATTISVPEAPVWLLAAAYCAAERGDGLGERAADLRAQAQQALSDAMQFGRDMNEMVATVE
jgi:hypothetical protein